MSANRPGAISHNCAGPYLRTIVFANRVIVRAQAALAFPTVLLQRRQWWNCDAVAVGLSPLTEESVRQTKICSGFSMMPVNVCIHSAAVEPSIGR